MTKSQFKKDTIRTLKAMFNTYDALQADASLCGDSEFAFDHLHHAIFSLAWSVCPRDCFSLDDIREYVFNH